MIQGYNSNLTMIDNRSSDNIEDISSSSIDNPKKSDAKIEEFEGIDIEDEVPFKVVLK